MVQGGDRHENPELVEGHVATSGGILARVLDLSTETFGLAEPKVHIAEPSGLEIIEFSDQSQRKNALDRTISG